MEYVRNEWDLHDKCVMCRWVSTDEEGFKVCDFYDARLGINVCECIDGEEQ